MLNRIGFYHFYRYQATWRVPIFFLIVLFYYALPNARPDFTPFSASDSENYLALSYSLVHGFGFTRNMVPGAYVPHLVLPPGLPLLVAPAVAAGGTPLNWLFVKVTIITIAVLGLLATWCYVRRVTSEMHAADLAMALLALNPFYWNFSRIVMTEVPTVAWFLGSLLLIDVVWAKRQARPWEAAAVGVLIGLGVLIKGIVIALIVAPLGYLVDVRGPRMKQRAQLGIWVAYAAGFVVFFLLWRVRNSGIDGTPLGLDSDPTSTDIFWAKDPMGRFSGLISPYEALRYHIIYNIPEQILPGLWSRPWQSWPLAAPVSAGLTVIIVLGALPYRRMAVPLFLTMATLSLLIIFASFAGGSRYWIPATSLMLVLLAIRLTYWLGGGEHFSWRHRWLLGGLMIGCGVSLATYIVEHEWQPFDEATSLGELVDLFSRARQLSEVPAAVLTPHDLAFTLSTGLPAPMTVPGLGIKPRYSHIITKAGAPIQPPAGSAVIVEVPPWRMYVLPVPMTLEDIQGAGRGK